MGKLKKAINKLIDDAYAKGCDGEKVAKRLIEAGINMMQEEDQLHSYHRIVPVDGGTFQIATRRDLEGVNNAALREAAEAFDDYACQHMAKTPPQTEKAHRNIGLAARCYQALGETYVAPQEPFDTPETPPTAPRKPQERDSPVSSPIGTLGDAKALLRLIYEAGENENPMLGVDVQIDDRVLLKALVDLGFVTHDDVSDKLGITTTGRDKLGIRPRGTIDLPVEVAEITGNVEEKELAARYCESKIAAIDNAIAKREAPVHHLQCSWEESYQHCALTLRAMADEFRSGLHVPTIHHDGRVIPYNEDRSTGIIHRDGLHRFFQDVHDRNVKAGWWTDITTGEPKKRSVGELFILFVTEISEAYDAYVRRANDDKLTQYPGVGVELADLGIRWADFCGALLAGRIVFHSGVDNIGDQMFREISVIADRYDAIRKTPEAVGQPETGEAMPAADVSLMVDAKLDYNATRADHKIENRLKDDGKRT